MILPVTVDAPPTPQSVFSIFTNVSSMGTRLSIIISAFLLYDYGTNDIGLFRIVQTWVLGEDEMDYRDAIEMVSMYEITPLEIYLEKYPNGKHVKRAKVKIEELIWDKAVKENSIESYEFYLEFGPSKYFR